MFLNLFNDLVSYFQLWRVPDSFLPRTVPSTTVPTNKSSERRAPSSVTMVTGSSEVGRGRASWHSRTSTGRAIRPRVKVGCNQLSDWSVNANVCISKGNSFD